MYRLTYLFVVVNYTVMTKNKVFSSVFFPSEIPEVIVNTYDPLLG